MATISKAARDRATGNGGTPAAPVDRRLAHRLVDELLDGELAEAIHRLDDLLATRNPQEQGLIARWIRPHPHKSGAADVVVAASNVPVYALIGDLSVAGDPDRVAEDYDVPREFVEAALAYYRLSSLDDGSIPPARRSCLGGKQLERHGAGTPSPFTTAG